MLSMGPDMDGAHAREKCTWDEITHEFLPMFSAVKLDSCLWDDHVENPSTHVHIMSVSSPNCILFCDL